MAYKEEKRKLWRPGSKLWYCTITKPLPCCNSSTLGYGSWRVRTNDLIVFNQDGDRGIGRVVGRLLTGGDGQELDKKKIVLWVIKASDHFGHFYMRPVDADDVVEIVSSHFGGEDEEPINLVKGVEKLVTAILFRPLDDAVLADLDQYGALSSHFIEDYVNDDGSLKARVKNEAAP